MIGQTIRGRRDVPIASIMFAGVGCGLLGLAFVDSSIHWAIGAVLPFCLAVPLLWPRYRPLAFTFTRTGVEVEEPPLTVEYDRIETIKAAKRPGNPDKDGPMHYPIAVVYDGGTLHLPPWLSVPSDEVFRFLLGTFPESGSRDVHPKLGHYLEEQIEEFGEELVHSFRARENLGAGRPGRELGVSLMLLVTGVAWFVIGMLLMSKERKPRANHFEVWNAVGIIFTIFAGLFSLLFWLMRRRQTAPKGFKGWREASLVISPLGLALIQGDLQGEMRWGELKDVRYRKGTEGVYQPNQQGMRGITLHFAGAIVNIVDIYDAPLNLIYQQLLRYWGR